ncbi:MAG TPA: hypothetical protein VGO91_00580 [Pyrinomonadaceae bacterium]|jgi:hypothetical protein|nr:hypothetical protein [Pyrinomonadaceae bacterium]
MTRQRHISTPFFAAAIYACACLLVYGTIGEAQVRQPAATANARQSASEKSALRVKVAFDFPAVERAVRKACVYHAMLSAALVAGHNSEEQIRSQSTRPASTERRATLDFSIPGETSCALLSRRLADS